MNIQAALDLIHDIREYYPTLVPYINYTQSLDPECAAFVWVSREVLENWYDCENIRCISTLDSIERGISDAKLFVGVEKHSFVEKGGDSSALLRYDVHYVFTSSTA